MYSAKTISQKLIDDGYKDMTVRKVNFYAFEKKMFAVSGNGKEAFSESDYEKLKTIAFLRENTKYTLDEIKEMIKEKSPGEIINSTVHEKISSYSTRDGACLDTLFQTNSSVQSPDIALTSQSYENTCFNTLPSNGSSTSYTTAGTGSYTYGTGTGFDQLRGFGNYQFPQSPINPMPKPLNQLSFSNLPKKEELPGNKTRVKLENGVFIEYDNTADKTFVNKLIEISKIIKEK